MLNQATAIKLLRTATILILTVHLSHIETAIVPPAWGDPEKNPCASLPGGWQLLYWAPLQKCFKIFQMGYPCPDTMELSPVAVGTRMNKNSVGSECRCPPNTAQSGVTKKCHALFKRGPCELGQYFSPMPEATQKPSTSSVSTKRWGACKTPKTCPPGMIFWPQNMQCYSEYTRGPCSKGKLLILNEDSISECKCENVGELARHFHRNGLCYEHYTSGPCENQGDLFLPGGNCGCYSALPHYDEETNQCYEIGSTGPCPPGHNFLIADTANASNHRASCQCKESYVLWQDDFCYRLYTRGPCENGSFLINSSTCIRNPCAKGRLYFPNENTCYRIGSNGPCSLNQVVIFDLTTRPSIDGISYNGVCGCPGVISNLDQHCQEDMSSESSCESIPGMVEFNGGCYKIYSRGPCGPGQWLESAKDVINQTETAGSGVCRCRPGYTSYKSESGITGCYAPSVSLARYLNGHNKNRTYKFEFRRFVLSRSLRNNRNVDS